MPLMETGQYVCPHCGEKVDTWPDPGGGENQQYVEDCPVCCRPNLIRASFSAEAGGFLVEAGGEI